MDEKYHNHCILCNSKKLKKLKNYEFAHLTKCLNCGLVFSKKIPSDSELIDHYNGYSRDDYLSPITIKRYNELLDEFEKFKKTKKILDVGCGIGYFLCEAKKRGWKVYGTEFTDEAIDICEKKGINMFKGKLYSDSHLLESYDVITSFEVIEHINNPQEEIESIYSLIRKGGLVYVTTPNFNSINRLFLRSKYNVIGYPEHLTYYTSKTLSKLFLKNNFKSKIKTTGLSISRIKTSIGYSQKKIISFDSDDEKIRVLAEKRIFLKLMKKILNFFLNLTSTGDTIKGQFIKN